MIMISAIMHRRLFSGRQKDVHGFTQHFKRLSETDGQNLGDRRQCRHSFGGKLRKIKNKTYPNHGRDEPWRFLRRVRSIRSMSKITGFVVARAIASLAVPRSLNADDATRRRVWCTVGKKLRKRPRKKITQNNTLGRSITFYKIM